MIHKNIRWVPRKDIDKNCVNQLFKKSIETGQFTNYGPNVKKLENIIREKIEVKSNKAVIVVTNGSVGLQVLAKGIEYQVEKEIKWATQSFTFPPSAQGTLKETIIVDIDNDGGLSLEEVEKNETRINGIIVTNVFGNLVDIDKYVKWQNKNNENNNKDDENDDDNSERFLIFDNAATPLSYYNGINSINYGNGSVISFHHTKPLGFGEGGAIIVDKRFEESIRLLINFGIRRDDIYWLPDGNNYKMSDISAVYIIQYINGLERIREHHNYLYSYFKNRYSQIKKKLIENHTDFDFYPSFHDENAIVASCFCLLFNAYNPNMEKHIMKNGVYCRKYYEPLKKMPNSSFIHARILCLPCTIDMTTDDIDYILDLILNFKCAD